MTAHKGGRCTAPLILNLVNLTSRPLYPQKRTPVPTDENAKVVSELVWKFQRKEKKLVPLPGIEPMTDQPSPYTDYTTAAPVGTSDTRKKTYPSQELNLNPMIIQPAG